VAASSTGGRSVTVNPSYVPGLGFHRHPGVHQHATAGRVVIPGQGRADHRHPGLVQVGAEPVVQRLDDRADRGRLEAAGHPVGVRDPDRGQGLDLDVLAGHCTLRLDDPEPRLDLAQPGLVRVDARAQLGPPQPQHPAQLLRADLVVDDRAYLGSR
jgi:hypothetical protein